MRLTKANNGLFTLSIQTDIGVFSTSFKAIEAHRHDDSMAYLVNGNNHKMVIQVKEDVVFWAMVFSHNVPIVYVTESEANQHVEAVA